ncbi:MAG: UPF0149 family protein [Idiomarina sp.]|nr:UPF0149 family protein [Idiomarina sp.]
MAQSAEQLIERFSQLGEPTTFDMPDFPEYQLDTAEIPAALSLTRAPQAGENKFVAAHAFMALTQRRDEKLLGELLQTADETLLLRLGEFVSTHAIPFYDIELVGELDTIVRHQGLSPVRRLFAAQLLQEFALLHPEYYGRTIKVIAACLQSFATNPSKVNAELIGACVTLQADELMPVIEQAYAADKVSGSDYAAATDVQAAMSVPETAFEQGLEQFMHTKELDEIRHELDQVYAIRTCAAPAGLELPIGNLAELDGFLHALALSPTPVARSLWIEQLSPGLLAEQGGLSQEHRLEKITTYYSVVKESLVVGECAPNFELSVESTVMNLNSMQPWARGFLLAAELWTESDITQAEAHEAYIELKEFLQAMAEDTPLPEQYQSLANSDYSMILQLMVQRVFFELNGMDDAQLGASDISDEDAMQDFFDNFS